MASSNSNRKQVFNAAALVGVLFAFNSILGYVRLQLIARYFGVSAAADAYALTSPIPELLFNIIAGGALGAAFIPVFASYFADEDNPDNAGAWATFSAIINMVVLATVVVSALAALFAPQLLALSIARDSETFQLSVPLLRVMLLTPIIFGIGGVFSAALNARQHFLAPALGANLYSVGIIGGLILFPGNLMGIGYGVVAGASLYWLVQIPAWRRLEGEYRPKSPINTPAVRRILWLMAPRVLGLSFSQFNPIIVNFIAQSLLEGSMAALAFGFRIMSMPQAIIGRALGVASFPTFAVLAKQSKFEEMRRILSDTLRLIIFIGTPITLGLVVLAEPLIGLALRYGAFDETASILTARALQFYAVGLVALAIIEIASRSFYALEDTTTPVVIGAVQLITMLIFSYWLGRIVFPNRGWIALGGVALGFSLSNWLEVGLLLGLLRPKMGGIDGARIAIGFGKMTIAGIAMTLCMLAVLWLTSGLADSAILLLVRLALAGGAGTIIYAGVCYLIAVTEMRNAITWIMRRLGRR